LHSTATVVARSGEAYRGGGRSGMIIVSLKGDLKRILFFATSFVHGLAALYGQAVCEAS